MSNDSAFLDEDEIIVLTGFRQPARQVQQLKEMGIAFYLNGARRPVISRVTYQAFLEKRERLAAQELGKSETARRWAEAAPLLAVQAAEERKARRVEKQRLMAERAQRRRETRPALVRFHTAKRRVAKLQRCAPWANVEAIKALYAEARRLTEETGIEHHVDHGIPLQGELVSGLHVENNLQILTGAENSRKKNRFEVE